MNINEVWEKVEETGLGAAIDIEVEPQDIADPVLSALWAEAQVKMNEIQLYFEMNLN